jgi:hypothetical protein
LITDEGIVAEYAKRQKGETIMSGLMVLIVIGLLYKGVNTLRYTDGRAYKNLIPSSKKITIKGQEG